MHGPNLVQVPFSSWVAASERRFHWRLPYAPPTTPPHRSISHATWLGLHATGRHPLPTSRRRGLITRLRTAAWNGVCNFYAHGGGRRDDLQCRVPKNHRLPVMAVTMFDDGCKVASFRVAATLRMPTKLSDRRQHLSVSSARPQGFCLSGERTKKKKTLQAFRRGAFAVRSADCP